MTPRPNRNESAFWTRLPIALALLGVCVAAYGGYVAFRTWRDQKITENTKMFREDVALLTEGEKISKLDTGALDFTSNIDHNTPVYMRIKYAEINLRAELSPGDYSLLLPLADHFHDAVFAGHCLSQITLSSKTSPDNWDIQAAYSAAAHHYFLTGESAAGRRSYEAAIAASSVANAAYQGHSNATKAVVMRKWMADEIKYAGDTQFAQRIFANIEDMHFGSLSDEFLWKSQSLELINKTYTETQFANPHLGFVQFRNTSGKILSYKITKEGQFLTVDYTGPDGTDAVHQIKLGK